MNDSLVQFELHSPAAILTMNRPEKRNALSRALIEALRQAFQQAQQEEAVRCVILTGAGKAFCAGMDLAELAETLEPRQQPGLSDFVWQEALRLATLYDLIFTFPKPTIAAVNGAAVAGGAGLVTVCDLALAEPEARFGYPEVRRGLVAAMVMPHLLRHVGERTARYLLLTGELISAEESSQKGLVNAVVPTGQVREQALALAWSLAQGGPQALAATKAFLRDFSRQAHSLEELARASAAPRLTTECHEGLQAFFAKRPAPWVCPHDELSRG